MLVKRRWVVLTFLCIVFATVTIASFVMTPQYTATATVKIEKESPNVLTFQEVLAIDASTYDFYRTQYKILESRALAGRVVDSLHLTAHPEYARLAKEVIKKEGEDGPRIARQVLVERFLKGLDIKPLRDSRLVEVSFTSPDEHLAAEAANGIARAYIEMNFDDKYTATEQAREWIGMRLDGLRHRVAKSEKDLQSYSLGRDILSLDEKQNIIVERLNALNQELTNAEGERMEKEARYRQVEGKDPETLPEIIQNPLLRSLKESYAELEREYTRKSEKYKPAYPEMVRLRSQLDRARERISLEVQKAVVGMRNEYQAALRRETSLRSSLEKQKAEVRKLNESSIEYNILKNEAETNRNLYNEMLQRSKEASIAAGLRASNISIVDPAEIPLKTSKPKKKLNMFLGLVVGLFGGAGLAFFLEYLDNTLNTPEEVERYIQIPSIGVIPSFSSLPPHKARGLPSGEREGIETISHCDSLSLISEAFRSVRTSVLLSSVDHPPHTILITSSQPGEGKTTAALNLAITLSKAGGRVVLVDADLRKPRCHGPLGLDNTIGLSSYLKGEVPFEELLQPTRVPALDIIVAGQVPKNPADLLSSKRMDSLIESLSGRYRYLILDSPPILGFSDTLSLSTLVDGVILVVKGGATPKDRITRARNLLRDVHSKFFGVILNNVEVDKDPYYYYSHYYYYGKATRKRKRRFARTLSTLRDLSQGKT